MKKLGIILTLLLSACASPSSPTIEVQTSALTNDIGPIDPDTIWPTGQYPRKDALQYVWAASPYQSVSPDHHNTVVGTMTRLTGSGREQGAQWNFHTTNFYTVGGTGILCNVTLYYYEAYFQPKPVTQIATVCTPDSCSPQDTYPGTISMAGWQGYWFNGAPITCTGKIKVGFSWVTKTLNIPYASMYVYESFEDYPGGISPSESQLIWTINSADLYSPFVSGFQTN